MTTLLGKPQGEANEIVRAYRSAMIERGLSLSTTNRRLSALRSLVALGKELRFVTFGLATKNVRAEAYRGTRGPEPDAMVALIQQALAHPHKTKAARDVAIFLLLGYGRALRRGEVVGLDLEHFDARGSRLSVLRKGKRERKWLSLNPAVTRKPQAWAALRGKEPGPLFLQLGKGGRVLAGRRLSGDGFSSSPRASLGKLRATCDHVPWMAVPAPKANFRAASGVNDEATEKQLIAPLSPALATRTATGGTLGNIAGFMGLPLSEMRCPASPRPACRVADVDP